MNLYENCGHPKEATSPFPASFPGHSMIEFYQKEILSNKAYFIVETHQRHSHTGFKCLPQPWAYVNYLTLFAVLKMKYSLPL